MQGQSSSFSNKNYQSHGMLQPQKKSIDLENSRDRIPRGSSGNNSITKILSITNYRP